MVTRVGCQWLFQVVCPNAQRVYLVGDFNRWSRSAVQMKRDQRGRWCTSIALQPGTYRFRYFTEDGWLNDYAAFGLLPNGFGGWDSVIWVPQEPQRIAPLRPVCDADAYLIDPVRLAE